MVRGRQPCQHRMVRRASRALSVILVVAGGLAPAAIAATETVSITLTPGAGLLLSGRPSLNIGADGDAELGLGTMDVRDATGSRSGWELAAEIPDPMQDQGVLLLRVDAGSDPTSTVELPADRAGGVVVVTVGPGF